MPSEIHTYLQSAVPINLSDTPMDYYPQFVLEASMRTKGTMQPPAPPTQLYGIKWEMQPEGLHYTLDVEWEPWVKTWLLRNIDPTQVWHRSRLLAVSGNELKVNEINYRLGQVRQQTKYVPQVALTDRQSYELFSIVADTTEKYMHIDPEWIRSYIHEHIQSSLGGGYKWRQAVEISIHEWSGIKDQLLGNLEEIRRQPGYYSRINWFSGIRARSEGLTKVQDHYDPPIMQRSRIILFHPSMSLWTIFIPQKAAWYTEVFEKAINYLQPVGEYHYPYVMGGQVYNLASQYFNNKLPFRANDGKNWESWVGLILGRYFHPFMVYFQDIPMLPSGETFTSMFGTLAALIATRKFPGKWIALGDDMNNFGGKPIPYPFIEYQPDDSRFKWILGIRYDIDPDQPRISGIKMSLDRAKSMIPMEQTTFTTHERVVSRKRDPRTRVAWAGLFKGWFGDRTLIQSLANIPPGEFISPGEYIERAIEEQVGTIDPYAWAEREGIKEVFTT